LFSGFVTMESNAAKSAADSLNNTDFMVSIRWFAFTLVTAPGAFAMPATCSLLSGMMCLAQLT
jgi:hypothetical protein